MTINVVEGHFISIAKFGKTSVHHPHELGVVGGGIHVGHDFCQMRLLDRPLEPVIGRRFAPTRWRTADAMLSSELGNRYAATRVYHADRRHRGGLAACGARAAASEKQQGPTAPSYESTLNAIRWRAAWVSPLSRNHHER